MSNDGDQPPRPNTTGDARDAVPGPMTSAGSASSSTEQPPRDTWHRRPGALPVAGLIAVLAVTAMILISTGSRPAPGARPAPVATIAGNALAGADAVAPVAPRSVSARELGALPQANTFGTVPGAPADPAPTQRTTGRIVHPRATVAVYAFPGGAAIAALPAQQSFGELTTDTKLPIVAEQPGWAQVLLPSRPDSSTGWVFLDDPTIATEHDRFRITVDRQHFALSVFENDTPIGHWTIGVGKPGAVTPAGRTFVLSSIAEDKPTFSRVIMPLGTHSNTFSTYGGGPGTVGIHTWPTSSVFGRASSDGCIRVPADALDVISSTVPLGSVVEIS